MLLLIISVSICIEIKYEYYESQIANIDPEYRLDRFYYNYITYREQLLYTNIAEAIESYAEYTKTLPYKYSTAEFERVMKYLLADNPEYFYLNASSASLYSSHHKTRIRLIYFNTPEEIESMKKELYTALDSAKISLDAKDNEFTREVKLHDYLIKICTFNNTDSNADGIYNTAYGALVIGKAYSDGYALALKLLYDKNDIYSLVVYGTANNIPHMWNMVYINERFYHVDASWDDADLNFEPELEFHGYFNLCDESILLDHNPDNKSILPSANDNNTYYNQNKTFVDSVAALDRIVYRELMEAGDASRDYIEIYLELSYDADDYYDIIIKVIDRVNNSQNKYKFMQVYRAYNASYTNNAITIQFFYIK